MARIKERTPSTVPMIHQVLALDIRACCSSTVTALLMDMVLTSATIPGIRQSRSVRMDHARRPPVETGGTGRAEEYCPVHRSIRSIWHREKHRIRSIRSLPFRHLLEGFPVVLILPSRQTSVLRRKKSKRSKVSQDPEQDNKNTAACCDPLRNKDRFQLQSRKDQSQVFMQKNDGRGNPQRNKQQIMPERAFPVSVQKRLQGSCGTASGAIEAGALIEEAQHAAAAGVNIGNDRNCQQRNRNQKRHSLPSFESCIHKPISASAGSCLFHLHYTQHETTRQQGLRQTVL